jgi:hypothetical protein
MTSELRILLDLRVGRSRAATTRVTAANILWKFFAVHPRALSFACPESPRRGDRTKRCVAPTSSG